MEVVDIKNKILDLMKDLVQMRDDCLSPQNFNVFLAKTSTEDRKTSKPQILSERSRRNSTAAARDSSHRSRVPERISTADSTSRTLSSDSRTTGAPSPSHLRQKKSSKIFTKRTANPKKIASTIEAQSSNLKLTPVEREALVSTIIINELRLRSKLAAQANELLFSDGHEENDSLITAPCETSSAEAQQEISETANTPTTGISSRSENATLDGTPLAETNKVNVEPSRSRPISRKSSGQRPKYGTKRSLTPIPEASEVPVLEGDTGDGSERRHILEGHKNTNLETLKTRENMRQQKMEYDLPSGYIEDTDLMLHQTSDESDSLDELVIKDFAIRVVESEPDVNITSLPMTEQAIIESKKLKEAMESVKERFQVKVARDKLAERRKVTKTPAFTVSTPTSPGKKKQNSQKTDENDNQTATHAAQVCLIDSENWGGVALHRPALIDQAKAAEELASSSDEDFLNEKDMQYDDLFGADRVSEPIPSPTITKVPKPNPKSPNRNQIQIENLLRSNANIEDFDNPEFSDLPSSDESVSQANLKISENIDDPQFVSDTRSGETANESAFKKSEQPRNEDQPVHETQHEKDIKKLKELLESGALASAITNGRFEEGVIDLLLRQSDSLWDPVVGGIPISYFIPSQNHEMGLLDTSINETDLGSPLIKKPKAKMPEYMESLENEWMTNMKGNVVESDGNIDNSVVDDEESLLLEGLPKYEPVPPNYRKKIRNLMDSEDESEESDEILDDDEMNIDDLIKNTAEPTYDFRKAMLFDDLEIKLKILHRLKENIESPAVFKQSHRQSNLPKPESSSNILAVFNRNEQQFNKIFGFVQNDTTNGTYIASGDIDLCYKRIPPIDSRIMRDVENCLHHLELMKTIYEKIRMFMSQTEKPAASSQTFHNLDEIIKTFNKIIDGRICARLPSCPTKNSQKILQRELKVTGRRDGSSQTPIKNNQATQTTRGNATQNQSEHQQPIQNPVKLRKSVSFADSVEDTASTTSGSDAKHKTSQKSQKNQYVGDGGRVNEWTTLNISEVRDLIAEARLAQAKYKGSTSGRSSERKAKITTRGK